jgi:hypothetical protein
MILRKVMHIFISVVELLQFSDYEL